MGGRGVWAGKTTSTAKARFRELAREAPTRLARVFRLETGLRRPMGARIEDRKAKRAAKGRKALTLNLERPLLRAMLNRRIRPGLKRQAGRAGDSPRELFKAAIRLLGKPLKRFEVRAVSLFLAMNREANKNMDDWRHPPFCYFERFPRFSR